MVDVLSQYTRRLGGDDDAADSPLRESSDDFVAFGWIRGVRTRANMLELRKNSGQILAVGYGWVEKISFDPSEGITIHSAGQRIHIRGRNLNAEVRAGVRLFEGLARGRVNWVREVDRTVLLEHDRQAVLVDEIVW